ncbi:PQQ-dependent sugar dehydrogenase [Gillisia sp. Hel_I_86]|uniref:PQQ-dependent sugar dehydrogenase n=1 Tax=Gillisia sp. Hel_I_86 TaxID=1249981 RepID=UPI0011A99C25|nr:PQQ-dependent sugar dehydrogenase [Gillisia sp. Hel_I_86]
MKINLFIIGFAALSFTACAQKDTSINESSTSYSYETIVSDLQIPWGMAFLPDGGMLITEKSGDLILFKNGEKQAISGVPEVYNRGQGGLMDIVLHPNYEQNGWIYISYSSSEGDEDGGNTAIMRAKVKDNQLTEKELLYKATPNTTKGQHFGSRMAFDKEGYMYFSIGERGERDINPQDITRDNGKIYRLNDDGSVPGDNPFVNEPDAKAAIYSFGHRNPQGMILHPTTGEIWVHEHGPKGGDEINIIKKAANYGWPVVTHGLNYSGTSITPATSKPGMEDPIYFWIPSIAPSGMAFVTSDKYPHLKNNLLVGSLKFQYLELDILEGEKVVKRERLLDGIGRVRDVKQGPNGYIYVAVEGLGIVKLIENEN